MLEARTARAYRGATHGHMQNVFTTSGRPVRILSTTVTAFAPEFAKPERRYTILSAVMLKKLDESRQPLFHHNMSHSARTLT